MPGIGKACWLSVRKFSTSLIIEPLPRTRFAPSPTGWLHLGHAYSAWFAWQAAEGGECLLRIEDIDQERSRPEYEEGIKEDLAWLGLAWPEPVIRQSERTPLYEAVLDRLQGEGLLYPCFCSRKEIEAELAQMPSAPHGPDGPLYPGTCRCLTPAEREAKSDQPYSLRLDMAEAVKRVSPLSWHDHTEGRQEAQPEMFGDVILARKDTGLSYHLCVVVDDHEQSIELVTRGLDLMPSTHLHRLLQELLGFEVPEYHHHRLVVDEEGKRLAKRSDSLAIRHLREQGMTPQDVVRMAESSLN